MNVTELPNPIDLIPVISRLNKDTKLAAQRLTPREARYLCDLYYQMQDQRIRAAHQDRAMSDESEPSSVFAWLRGQSETLESRVQTLLDAYSKGHRIGRWMRSVTGIGPVIAAGMIAHLDVGKAPTPGHFFSFAGLSPDQKWAKGQKRPWNARLKVLCWKLGESFVKSQGIDGSFYGPLYAKRKAYEWDRNLKGENANAASDKSDRFGDDTNAKLWYTGQINPEWARMVLDGGKPFPQSIPENARVKNGTRMIPPAHVHARATRWTVKLFLSHLHQRWWEFSNPGRAYPCTPYAIAHLGHMHMIEAPEAVE